MSAFLAETADNPGCDADTQAFLWEMISVIQPPEFTPRALGKQFA